MNCTAQQLKYKQIGVFSKLVVDYLDGAPELQSFFAHNTNIDGIKKAIIEREKISTNRNSLVTHLHSQYAGTNTSIAVQKNIELLLQQNTFTITTAHQPNLFTGPLYFLYKILHAIKLASSLKLELQDYNFVPVYYMGSEDADVDELAHFWLNGTKHNWQTQQSGAFGRFIVDKELVSMIDAMSGEIGVQPYGNALIEKLRQYYKIGITIQEATFQLINNLFSEYGLIVLIADSTLLKQQMIAVFEDELINHTSSKLVEQTAKQLQEHYKVQAGGREINLFYLDEDLRERIEVSGDSYAIANTTITFTKDEMLKELIDHPERFSPNVILRGLYQETILPNITFIGGGGEIAYWLELKSVFENYKVPFPVLVLRNSFLIVEKKWKEKLSKLNILVEESFLPTENLLNRIVSKESTHQLKLNGSFTATEHFYEQLKQQASVVDITLAPHVEALKTKAIYRLQELEKKILRAEKRKFANQKNQIEQMKTSLFPNNGLQERVDNFSSYYAKWGKEFIQLLYENSLSLEQEFVVVHFD